MHKAVLDLDPGGSEGTLIVSSVNLGFLEHWVGSLRAGTMVVMVFDVLSLLQVEGLGIWRGNNDGGDGALCPKY